jgi:hypothetical protein
MPIEKMTVYDLDGQRVEEREYSYEIPLEQATADAIRQRLRNGIADNQDFIAAFAPTVAEIGAHVKRMARRQNAIMRLLLGALEEDS